jgi:hypothetical protein
MYEPYGEKKRFSINTERLKEWKGKAIEKIKTLRYNKWAMIIIAVAVIVVLGGYTGWMTYTGKVAEINSQILILERQVEACQNNVSSCLSDLEATGGQLVTCQTNIQDCKNKLENAKSGLDQCNIDKGLLRTSLQELESSISEWETRYEELESDYSDLEEDHEDMSCQYASDVCGRAGMDYYFVKDDTEIVCCWGTNLENCVEEPDSEDDIKEITC